MPIGFFGCFGFVRINNNDFGTAFLSIFNDMPVMQISADGIAAPDNDVFRMNKAFRIHASSWTNG